MFIQRHFFYFILEIPYYSLYYKNKLAINVYEKNDHLKTFFLFYFGNSLLFFIL